MHILIAKVNENLFEGEAHSLTVPAVAGEMTVLLHHEPLITTLKKGQLVVRMEAGQDVTEARTIDIEGGILEVTTAGATVIL